MKKTPADMKMSICKHNYVKWKKKFLIVIQITFNFGQHIA